MMRQIPLAAAGLAGLSVIGVIVNIVLVLGNRQVEADVQARQQTINSVQQLTQVSNALVQALGQAALNTQDAAITGLLADFGFTVTANPPAPATPASAPTTPSAGATTP